MTTEESKSSETAPGAENENPDQERMPQKKSILDTLASHWRLIGVLLLVLALGVTYLWKNVAVSMAKAQVTSQAAAAIAAQNKSCLRLAAVPLVWTVRSEMLRGNYDQINQYLAQFVREPNMKEVLVAGADGRVVAATDKKREGAMVAELFPPEVPKVDTITVTTRPDGRLLVAAPIMGLNDRLGVLILIAAPPSYPIEQ